METVDPPAGKLPLLSVTENLPCDLAFLSPPTPPLPSLEDHFWEDPDSEVTRGHPKGEHVSTVSFTHRCFIANEHDLHISLLNLICPILFLYHIRKNPVSRKITCDRRNCSFS